MTTFVIDLGEVRDVDAPPPRPRGVRWWGRILVLALLGLVGASAPMAREPLRDPVGVPVGTDGNLRVAGSTVFVASFRHRRNEISAYDLRTGHPLWTMPLDLFAGETIVTPIGGVVIVSTPANGLGSIQSEAFDAATGARRWTSPYDVADVTGDGAALLTSFDPRTGYALRRADAATGAVAWTTRFGPACSYAIAPDDLVEACPGPAMRLRLVDLRTGRAHASRSVPLADVTRADREPGLLVSSGFVIVTDTSATPSPTAAYRLDDLSLAWSAAAVLPNESITDCDGVLCRPLIGGSVEVDAETGKVIGPLPPDGPVAGYYLVAAGRVAAPLKTTPVAIEPPDAMFAPPPVSPGPVWLSRGAAGTSLVEPLAGAGPYACVQIAGYLACTTSAQEMTFWRVPA